MENNSIYNADTGIDVSERSYGAVLRGNDFQNVTLPLRDSGMKTVFEE